MKPCLAVDIGGTKIAVAIIDSGGVRNRNQVSTPSSTDPEDMDAVLEQLLTPFLADVDMVAVASTGIINNGILTALNPKNLGGLNEYPLQSVIERILKKPTYVINDAQAAAWAEYQTLELDMTDMAFITVSTGVGAGIVINNELVIGTNGIAGHVGHTLADPNGPICGCRRQGCVESIASGTAIGQAGKPFFGDSCDGEMVFKHFAEKNKNAQEIISTSAQAIANLIADLKMVLDIELVALGGSVGLAPGYIQLVQHHLSQQPKPYQIKIQSAVCGANAGLIGVENWVKHNL
ncbi:N-acetylmannosamine kinase [Photobacterium carnosum]|uniref:N-acetylmannosamine kinase n=1 Tax=Photobacterium carnosum TaxID=2023717 RepID=UPI001E37C2BE|nr:N-acetylmannosamine kinase [Photobacterium carnosum]MCD9527839.1 ROK family protein [Photobacterium carnosum]